MPRNIETINPIILIPPQNLAVPKGSDFTLNKEIPHIKKMKANMKIPT